MELSAASTFWQGIPLDSEQEAIITFTRLSKESGRQKPQSNGIWGEGVAHVLYDAPNQRIQVWMVDSEKGWVQAGKDIPVEFADGDRFSVRFGKDGSIEIYRNGKLLTRRALSSLPHPADVTGSTPEPVAAQKVFFVPVGLPFPGIPALQLPASLTIDYTYDALHRLTGATYSDGRDFSYTYDAAGNVLELQKNLGPGTVVTTYTYDTANQLQTAAENGVTWQYHYDANGSLIETLPDGSPASGAKRYTYNAAGNLVQVEAHNGSDWETQAEMDYNGLGQRLSMDAAGVIAHYVLDTSSPLSAGSNQPLTAESGGNATTFLYGLGPIGEKTNVWNFALPDGLNTPRQLTDAQGDVTLSTRYTPWGGILDTYGTGNFTYGYLGGILDAATDLIYVGNGQYYDPATGRFLTRGVFPNSTNPYMPWNPFGALIGRYVVTGRAGSVVTNTLSTRRASISTTSKRRPSHSNWSAARGIFPSEAITKPARVS
jgi:YD repeat-containing protein